MNKSSRRVLRTTAAVLGVTALGAVGSGAAFADTVGDVHGVSNGHGDTDFAPADDSAGLPSDELGAPDMHTFQMPSLGGQNVRSTRSSSSSHNGGSGSSGSGSSSSDESGSGSTAKSKSKSTEKFQSANYKSRTAKDDSTSDSSTLDSSSKDSSSKDSSSKDSSSKDDSSDSNSKDSSGGLSGLSGLIS